MKIESAWAHLFRKLFNNMKYQNPQHKLPVVLLFLVSLIFTSTAQELSEQDKETFNQGDGG